MVDFLRAAREALFDAEPLQQLPKIGGLAGVHVQVLTTCTAAKIGPADELQLPTLADLSIPGSLERNEDAVRDYEVVLKAWRRPAEDLYRGQQHLLLMQGVQALRQTAGARVDVHVVSAGYGIVPGDRQIVPYNISFAVMHKRIAHAWADGLHIPAAFKAWLATPCDLKLMLLSEPYFEVVRWSGVGEIAAPVVVFCSPTRSRRLIERPQALFVPLGNTDAKRLSCGLIALKGAMARRLLEVFAFHRAGGRSHELDRSDSAESPAPDSGA